MSCYGMAITYCEISSKPRFYYKAGPGRNIGGPSNPEACWGKSEAKQPARAKRMKMTKMLSQEQVRNKRCRKQTITSMVENNMATKASSTRNNLSSFPNKNISLSP